VAVEELYRTKRNEVRKAARADKEKWLDKQCREIEKYHAEFNTREVYKMIRNVNRKWQPNKGGNGQRQFGQGTDELRCLEKGRMGASSAAG